MLVGLNQAAAPPFYPMLPCGNAGPVSPYLPMCQEKPESEFIHEIAQFSKHSAH